VSRFSGNGHADRKQKYDEFLDKNAKKKRMCTQIAEISPPTGIRVAEYNGVVTTVAES